jgi:hypothetical protein
MVDIVYNAPDISHLVSAAIAMGFYVAPDADHPQGQILTNGEIPGGGSWFFNHQGVVYVPTGATTTDEFGNIIPVMAPLPGIWGRLRHNGDPQWLPTLPANSGVTLYWLTAEGFWSADGVTPAPDYVATIGAIA